MRTAILLLRKHDSKEFELAHGPEVGIADQQADFRELLSNNGIHGTYAEAQLWTSDGGMHRTLKFKSEDHAKAEAVQAEKDNAAMKANLEAQAKSKKGEPKVKPKDEPATQSTSPKAQAAKNNVDWN